MTEQKTGDAVGGTGVADRLIEALARIVSRFPKATLGICTVAIVVFGALASTVGLEIDFFAIFETADEAAELSDEYVETFEIQDDSLVAVVVADEPNDERAIEAVAELTERAEASTGVVAVASITNTGVIRPPGIGDPELAYAPIFSPDLDDLTIEEQIDLARGARLGSRQLISDDGRVMLVIADLDPALEGYDLQAAPAKEFRQSLTDVAAGYDDVLSIRFAGLGFTVIESVEQSARDLSILFPLAIVIMVVLAWLFFRSVWAIVGIVGAIIASVVATLGVMGALGDDLTQFTTGFPVILIGVTVATSTHIVHRYFEAVARGASAPEATQSTIRMVSGVSLLCSGTNALGFLSLLVASVPAIRDLGIYLAIGVGFCFLFTATLIPAVLQFFNAEAPSYYRSSAKDRRHPIDGIAERYARWMTRPSRAIAISLAGLVAVGLAYGATEAEADYKFSTEFPPSTELGATNALIDDQLEGTIPVEISLRGQAGSWSDPNNLRDLQDFDVWLRVNEGLWTLGVPSVVAELDVLGIPLPGSAEGVEELVDLTIAEYPDAEDFLAQVVTEDRSWARLTAFRPENGSREFVEMADRIEAEAAERFGPSGIEVRVTGQSAVTFRGVSALTGELVNALTLAVISIVTAIAIGLRSVRVALVALLPNAAPLALGFAAYMAVNDVLDPLVAAVFAIVLGVAADDTVHLANSYLQHKRSGMSPEDAVVAALTGLWRAMISSTVVLLSAFVVLSLSSFASTRLVGGLGTMLLLFALLADIVFGVAGISILAALDRRRERKLGASEERTEADEPSASEPGRIEAAATVGGA